MAAARSLLFVSRSQSSSFLRFILEAIVNNESRFVYIEVLLLLGLLGSLVARAYAVEVVFRRAALAL